MRRKAGVGTYFKSLTSMISPWKVSRNAFTLTSAFTRSSNSILPPGAATSVGRAASPPEPDSISSLTVCGLPAAASAIPFNKLKFSADWSISNEKRSCTANSISIPVLVSRISRACSKSDNTNGERCATVAFSDSTKPARTGAGEAGTSATALAGAAAVKRLVAGSEAIGSSLWRQALGTMAAQCHRVG